MQDTTSPNGTTPYSRSMRALRIAGVIGGIVALGALGTGEYLLYQELVALQAGQERLGARIASTTRTLSSAQDSIVALQDENRTQQDVLANLDRRMSNVDGQVSQIRKIQNTDPELLAKYSKTYFLNEHYEPGSLATVPERYRYPPAETEEFHGLVWPKLRGMLEDAREDGVELLVLSGYRSFEEQQDLKSHYDVVYGEDAANQFSAPQGYSEHQLGTTVDFTTPALEENFESIDGTNAYAWLQQHAHDYGFILSYPENNGYYQFEPWHWRYVGEELAQKLERDNEHFYDLSQRTIDTYRDKFFD